MDQVLVAGAGIVGVSTAIWLQRAGYRVTLVDREGPAAGTSYGNAGILAASGLVPVTVPGLMKKAPGMVLDKSSPLFLRWTYFPKLIPFLIKYMGFANARSVEHYAAAMSTLLGDTVDQHKALAKDTPAEKFITDLDYCFGYQTEKLFKKDAYSWDVKKRHGVRFEVVSGEEFTNYDPLYEGQFHTVVRNKDHGTITDPPAYIIALVDHFVEQGGTLEIASIERIVSEDGKVTGLKTDTGLMSADQVVLTLGAWSKPLAKDIGLKFPLEAERGYHIELVNPSQKPVSPMMVAASKFVITPMLGRIRCAGVVEFGGLKAGKSKAPLDLITRQFKELLPDVTYDCVDTWLGHRPATPNSLPAIGTGSKFDNAYIGVGHQHLGLTGGPKTGRIIADLMSGAKPNIDLEPFAPQIYE